MGNLIPNILIISFATLSIVLELTFFSKPNSMANINMKTMVDDLVIVYSETDTRPKAQFEKPISMPLATPVGAIFLTDVRQSNCILDLPTTNL